jgi:hypothetical protein
MNYQQFELPNQNLPESKWTKKVYLDHANRMIEYIGNDTSVFRNENIAKYYRRYSCELSPKEQKANDSMTKQYGFELGVEYMIYPLCEMIVDQLASEYFLAPVKKKLYSINKDAINSKLDEKIKYISEEIFRELNAKMENELGFVPETEDPEIDLPDDVEEFFAKDYKTNSEELGEDIVEQVLEANKEKRKLKALLLDFLIGEQSIAWIDEKDGHPTIKRAKYDECYIDINPDEEIQTDINIFAAFPFHTKNEILNKYELDKEQIEKIDALFAKMETGRLLDEPFSFGSRNGVDSQGYNNCSNGISYRNWYDSNAKNRLRVMVMKWKSRKTIRAKVFTNQHTGEEIFKILKPDYKERKGDDVKKVTIEVVREIEMIGPEIVLRWGESKERLSYIDNKKKVSLPVIALIGRNTMYSSEIRSVVAKIEPLQKMASDLLFELRLSMKANDGRVLVYDTAQIPKQFLDEHGKNAVNRVLHHIKKDKIILLNSKDKVGSRAAFNQFTALDLSNRGQTQDIINGLMLIEDLGRKFVGLSKERTGEVGQYQTASGTDRAVTASNARTEVYFSPFDEFVQALLDKVLMKSKTVYKKGQVFQHIFGDLKTKFLTIFQDYFNSDLGIYFADRFKNKKDKEIIDMAAQQALGNATEKELILDLINVLQTDSATESKAILEKSLTAFQALQAENAKAAQAAEEAKQAHEMAKEDRIDARDKAKNINNIEVAKIYADNKTFNEHEQRSTEELIAAAKLSNERLKIEKDSLKKDKPAPKTDSK